MASVSRLAVRRLVASSVDWLIIVGYAAALVPVGLLMRDRSVQLSPWAWNVLSFALLIAPATVWLAAWEAAPRGASPGKRLLRLRVQTSQGLAPGFARSLVRNGLKVALPWELGHTAAFSLAASSAADATMYAAMACGIAACVVGCGCVASLFVGSGRTPYDLIAGTSVIIGQTLSSNGDLATRSTMD